MTVQIIEHEGKPTFAVVPIAEWTAMKIRMKELQDMTDSGEYRTPLWPVESA